MLIKSGILYKFPTWQNCPFSSTFFMLLTRDITRMHVDPMVVVFAGHSAYCLFITIFVSCRFVSELCFGVIRISQTYEAVNPIGAVHGYFFQ